MIRRRKPAPVPLSDDELESDIPAPYKTRGSKMNTNACHIIKRSLAIQEKGSNSIFFMWDILRYYGELSKDILANLENVIDSPANGILLEKTLHYSVDNFEVVFVPHKSEANTYKIRWIDEQHLFYTLAVRRKVTFSDHTGGLHQLPNPKLFATHSHCACTTRWGIHRHGDGVILS
ncbi:hypothetical protein BD410DRAFT_521473 [Rickenella mellea]|uniref:HNH nuclease domain-containing protein n=1 Tax=Rickenella mellea TaxID=50990 RepID=A0A4Y7QGR7_9AGAM|nr:hypothetical protein BD410DRAFT_521473 [Rickenella mellea]